MKNPCVQKRLERIYLVVLTAILFLHKGVNAQESNIVWVKKCEKSLINPCLLVHPKSILDSSDNR